MMGKAAPIIIIRKRSLEIKLIELVCIHKKCDINLVCIIIIIYVECTYNYTTELYVLVNRNIPTIIMCLSKLQLHISVATYFGGKGNANGQCNICRFSGY